MGAERDEFSLRWYRRFTARGAALDDDAGIAGWTPTGLAARSRQFRAHWSLVQPPGERWLDIGCGAGTYCRHLHNEGREVVGVDYAEPSLRKARDRAPAGVGWLVADARALPFPAATFDGVLCFGVMQALSVAGRRCALSEMARVVRPGGEVWVDALNGACFPHVWAEWRRRLQRRAPHLRYDRRAGLREAMVAAGLEPLECHWLPLLPPSWARGQEWVEGAWLRRLLDASPRLASRLSHSYILRAWVPR
ncbi:MULTISPECIES: class I SAM-dependent methyltransferase [Halorhodospira]|uniref:class I SAM-dependent methyltransferase n=1 Tax=Halorhodospira TaxID=85108 RepID=UPI001911A78B|nr:MULTISPECIES: class I SAM-dependent methyltransferase [Halorhodospira]MBK5936120.1 SAM-dependent methyltransferase [Halorhodospira halophila]MCG5537274.1 class I SAM-dependent methyltransferase [Halorhodospira sp. 9622]MCG5540162.1 class I SAM-dependent methyltransferase [Halorhodospira sp. M39old]MCG5545137.1 class I SAM-dependent methyltransferase [Halorhodospira sp. M38]